MKKGTILFPNMFNYQLPPPPPPKPPPENPPPPPPELPELEGELTIVDWVDLMELLKDLEKCSAGYLMRKFPPRLSNHESQPELQTVLIFFVCPDLRELVEPVGTKF